MLESPRSPSSDRSTFVLLHGGRHGGWCWRKVGQLLNEAGHEVYAPTLTGLGDRAHLLSRDIGLSTHVRDLVNTFEFEDIRDAVMVAHSYGGMVVSGAMPEIGDRVRSVIHLDSQVPETGQSVFDLIGPERASAMRTLVDEQGEGWYVPPSDVGRYGITDPDDLAWTNSRITAQPVKTYTEPVGPTGTAWTHPGMFVECVPSRIEPEVRQRAREREEVDPDFLYRVLDAPHDAMISHPGLVSDLLLEALDIG